MGQVAGLPDQAGTHVASRYVDTDANARDARVSGGYTDEDELVGSYYQQPGQPDPYENYQNQQHPQDNQNNSGQTGWAR